MKYYSIHYPQGSHDWLAEALTIMQKVQRGDRITVGTQSEFDLIRNALDLRGLSDVTVEKDPRLVREPVDSVKAGQDEAPEFTELKVVEDLRPERFRHVAHLLALALVELTDIK